MSIHLALRHAQASARWAVAVFLVSAGVAVPSKAQPPAPPPAPLAFVPFSQRAVHPEIRVLGRILPQEETRLGAEVSARILTSLPTEGSVVKKGALLVTLDSTPFALELAKAQAQKALLDERVALARLQWGQAQRLAEQGFSSQEALEIRHSNMQVLLRERDAVQKNVEAAELALSKTRITAPFEAVVMARHASQGDLAHPGTPLLTLVSHTALELQARLPEAYADLLDETTAVQWHPDNGPPQGVRLLRLSPAIDTITQTRLAVFSVPPGSAPGRAGRLQWPHPTPHLPAAYLQAREGVYGVFVQKEGQTVFIPLPEAQPGRPLPLDWPLETLIADEGRLRLTVMGTATHP